MITLRAPRFFAFLTDLPSIPFPFRGDLSKFSFPWRTSPRKKAARLSVRRSQRSNPTQGAFVINLNQYDGKGNDIRLRRELFRR